MKEVYTDKDIENLYKEIWIAYWLDNIRPKGTDLDAAVVAASEIFDIKIRPALKKSREQAKTARNNDQALSLEGTP